MLANQQQRNLAGALAIGTAMGIGIGFSFQDPALQISMAIGIGLSMTTTFYIVLSNQSQEKRAVTNEDTSHDER